MFKAMKLLFETRVKLFKAVVRTSVKRRLLLKRKQI